MRELIYHSESESAFYDEFTQSYAEQGCVPLDTVAMLPSGTSLPAGLTHATVIPDMDFETYSDAGYIWDGVKYHKMKGATKYGIFAVGACVYAEHPSCEVLMLSYDLKDGGGSRSWLPGMAPPQELFDHIAAGGLIEAHNCAFEFWIWKHVCEAKLGWPPLPQEQLRDSMAKTCAFALPAGLGKAAEVLNADVQKHPEGQRLIKKFSCPRKPTKKDPRRRILLSSDANDAQVYLDYNVDDIRSEAAVSMLCPDLNPSELKFWQCTQAMNLRGCQLDMQTVHAACSILDQALERYNAELTTITGGTVTAASQVSKLIGWLGALGVHTSSLDAEGCEVMLARNLPPAARRAIEIRGLVGSAGVKKLYAMARMSSKAGRAHDMFQYHGARTGRDTGRDLQPQNLVKAGPKLFWCEGCGKPYGRHLAVCPHCSASATYAHAKGWSWKAVDTAVEAIRTGSLDVVEAQFGDAVLTLSGCIRGMFVASAGKELVCSDYSSIEAVVTAVLAGEEWRIEAFRQKQDIYLVSASRITGTTLEEYMAHPDGPKGSPDRQKIGKPAELGLGFGGYIGAWRQFDKTDNFSDDEVKRNVMAWREASPMIVELWGGQSRGKPWNPDSKELYGLEGMAIAAILNPEQWYQYRLISYIVHNDILYCALPSGRYLTYHKPRLITIERFEGCPQYEITFEGWNTNPKNGPTGWQRMNTFGGRLTENSAQAVARDIMAHTVPLLEKRGYECLLRVHDEVIAEVPTGYGSIFEFENIMGTLPPWAEGWPIRAADGWRGHRYRKD